MKPTPHVHAELIKQWADAPEYWDVYFYANSLSQWSFTETPYWYGGHKYKIEKSAKHPDNIKPKKKLIDWSKMPRGTMTNRGEIMCLDNYQHPVTFSSELSRSCVPASLRLAEQTEFTYWGGGECPVPEGVVVEVVVRNGRCSREFKAKDWEHRGSRSDDIIAYRITGLADGWTDNPEDAA